MHDVFDDPAHSTAAATFPGESFGRLLEKEIERSQRYYRAFGLIEVRCGQETPVDGRGESGTPGAPAAWADGVARILRRADLVASCAEGQIFVLLPETPASAMSEIASRVEEAVTGREALPASPVAVVSHASFPRDGQTLAELLAALREPR